MQSAIAGNAAHVSPVVTGEYIQPQHHRSRVAKWLAAFALASALGGCYIVPLQPDGRPYPVPGVTAPVGSSPVAAFPAPASPSVIPVRMYPTNDIAAPAGAVAGSVTSYASGRADFQFIRAGETFSGEATRYGGQKNGVANAAGTRGGYANCQYAMNNPAQSTGTCKFSDGALYSLHVGQ
jgi:hypothetical protein